MRRSDDRILTTHTGALHRPRDLEELLKAKLEGRDYDEEAYEARLTTAVDEIVATQLKAGVDIVNDGEFSKPSWTYYVIERLSGLEFSQSRTAPTAAQTKDSSVFADFYEKFGRVWPHEDWEIAEGGSWRGTPVVTGPISYTGHAQIERDIANLQKAVAAHGAAEAFLPVVAPGSVQPVLANEYYPDDESYFEALAGVLREEYLAITRAGLIVQVDDAFMPYLFDLRKDWSFEQFRTWANLAVEALCSALAGIPEEQVRYHICWGSWNGPHSADVPLRDIIDLVLRVPAQAYNIESANPRHAYEWTVWQDVKLPEGKILIPGVVEHATFVLEHPETVAERIERFTSVVGRENVIAGTDCGHRGRVPRSLVWAKQQAITDGAALASHRLWGDA